MQREFARLVCLECGYDFNLSCATHKEMLEASILSFDKADSSLFVNIFSRAVVPYDSQVENESVVLNILTSDDLIIGAPDEEYEYYEYGEKVNATVYNEIYKARIRKMDAETLKEE